jgi:hypothetical protein
MAVMLTLHWYKWQLSHSILCTFIQCGKTDFYMLTTIGTWNIISCSLCESAQITFIFTDIRTTEWLHAPTDAPVYLQFKFLLYSFVYRYLKCKLNTLRIFQHLWLISWCISYITKTAWRFVLHLHLNISLSIFLLFNAVECLFFTYLFIYVCMYLFIYCLFNNAFSVTQAM